MVWQAFHEIFAAKQDFQSDLMNTKTNHFQLLLLPFYNLCLPLENVAIQSE